MTPRLIASVLLLSTGTLAFGQSVEQVVKAWADKRAGIRNVRFELNIEYFKARKTEQIKGMTFEKPEINNQHHATVILDFEGGRYRYDKKGEEYSIRTRKNEPCDGTTVYDGTNYRSMARPNGGGTDTGISSGRASDYVEITGDLSRQQFPNHFMPIFYACGVVPIEPNGRLYPSQFHKYDPSQFADVMFPSRRSPGTATSSWFEVPESDTRIRTEYQVGNGPQAAVLAQTRSRDGKPSFETTIKYHTLAGRLAPQSWEYKSNLDGQLHRYRVTVERIDYNQELPASLFQLSPEDGMVAAKLQYAEPGQSTSSTPTRETYEVKDGGKLVRNDSLNPFADPRLGSPTASQSANRFWYWVGGVAGVTLLIASVIAFVRMRRKRQNSSVPSVS